MVERIDLTIVVLVLSCLLMEGVNGALSLSPEDRVACTQGLICAVNKNQLDFFAIGDTGGIEFNIGQLISYVRPTSVQLRVADAMAKLAAKKGLDFVINVGGNSIDVDSRSVFSWMSAAEKVPKGPEPPFVDEAKKQWKLLEKELKATKADYVFVVGHYPIHSLSLERLKCMYEKLDPLLRKYLVTAYIAGHDHSVQYFKDEGDAERPPMHYLVTGAGSRTGPWGNYVGDEDARLLYRYPKKVNIPLITSRYVQKHNEFGFGQGAFVHFTIRRDRADLYFYAKASFVNR